MIGIQTRARTTTSPNRLLGPNGFAFFNQYTYKMNIYMDEYIKHEHTFIIYMHTNIIA